LLDTSVNEKLFPILWPATSAIRRPGYMVYANDLVLPRPEVADTEIVMPLDLPDIDIFDKRYSKVLFSQERYKKFLKLLKNFNFNIISNSNIKKILENFELHEKFMSYVKMK